MCSDNSNLTFLHSRPGNIVRELLPSDLVSCSASRTPQLTQLNSLPATSSSCPSPHLMRLSFFAWRGAVSVASCCYESSCNTNRLTSQLMDSGLPTLSDYLVDSIILNNAITLVKAWPNQTLCSTLTYMQYGTPSCAVAYPVAVRRSAGE